MILSCKTWWLIYIIENISLVDAQTESKIMGA